MLEYRRGTGIMVSQKYPDPYTEINTSYGYYVYAYYYQPFIFFTG